ncbi:PRK06851 family protein [Romboutsia lituseburensis]|uniref:PRK06851 family protein n=1 Tax=Romboutsia lituseburensis TaxID=1537 RepID=UPI00215A56A0|nr:PRK06851 family protein [Romboutsia lituseburensis]MCR8746137.1 PRK06851 family protein [Romboutsia lituseburensis]
MEGKSRKLFPGANTANGSFNFFDNIITKNVNRIFCLKGGPGVGKSSLMKKIANEFLEKGYDIELHYCPSDPSSLDAVLIKELGVVLLDGTAPHIVDPKDPGAIDEIVNLGEYWNLENLEKNKVEIVECGKDISSSFRRAYKYLKSAEPIYYDIEEKYKDCMDFGQVNLLTEHFIYELFKNASSTGIYQKERNLFGTAITPIGHVDYADSILSEVSKVYHLSGNIGTGKTTFLKRVCDKAIKKGMEVEVYHYPLIKDKLETIIIKDLNIGITTSKLFEGTNTIDLDKYLDQYKLAKYEEEINFDKKVFDELINYGISNLKKAKAKHDVIEAHYVPNMRFDEIEALRKDIVNRILKYEK